MDLSENHLIGGRPLVARLFTLVLSFGTNLIIAGIICEEFGEYYFGLWATFSSIATLLAFLDLSIPQLLFNFLTSNKGAHTSVEESKFVRNVQFFLFLLSLFSSACLLLLFRFGGFKYIVPGLTHIEQINLAFSVLMVLFALPFTIGSRILQFQKKFQLVIFYQGLIPLLNLMGISLILVSNLDKSATLLLPSLSYLITTLAIYKHCSQFLSAFKLEGLLHGLLEIFQNFSNLRVLIFGTFFGMCSNLIWNLPRFYLADPTRSSSLALYSFLMLFLSPLQSLVLSYNSNQISSIRQRLLMDKYDATFIALKKMNFILMTGFITMTLILVYFLNFLSFLSIANSFYLLMPILGLLWANVALFLGIYTDGESLRDMSIFQCFGFLSSIFLVREFSSSPGHFSILMYLAPILLSLGLAQRKIRSRDR